MELNGNLTPNPRQASSHEKRSFFLSLGVGIVVIILSFFFLFDGGLNLFQEQDEPQGSLPTAEDTTSNDGTDVSAESPAPEPTGDIDDISQALILDAEGEYSLVEDQNDSDLVTNDDDVLNEYENFYNENDL